MPIGNLPKPDRLLVTILVAALPHWATATPFVVSDPVVAGVVRCGVTLIPTRR